MTLLLYNDRCVFFFLLPDVLGPVLCGHQPLQEPAHLFREHHRDVQREETT